MMTPQSAFLPNAASARDVWVREGAYYVRLREADSILPDAVIHQFDIVPDGSAINGNTVPKSECPASLSCP